MNLNKTFYLLDLSSYNDEIIIYKGKPEIIKNNISVNYNEYVIKMHNYVFEIHTLKESNKSLFKCISKIYKNELLEEEIGTTKIIFSSDEEEILKYYELQLQCISEILRNKKIQLEKNIKNVEYQKHILYTNPKNLFKVI
jgi:hypothetical protein